VKGREGEQISKLVRRFLDLVVYFSESTADWHTKTTRPPEGKLGKVHTIPLSMPPTGRRAGVVLLNNLVARKSHEN